VRATTYVAGVGEFDLPNSEPVIIHFYKKRDLEGSDQSWSIDPTAGASDTVYSKLKNYNEIFESTYKKELRMRVYLEYLLLTKGSMGKSLACIFSGEKAMRAGVVSNDFGCLQFWENLGIGVVLFYSAADCDTCCYQRFM